MNGPCQSCGYDAGMYVEVCPQCGSDGEAGGPGNYDDPTVVDGGPRRSRDRWDDGDQRERAGGHTVYMREDTIAASRRGRSLGLLVVRRGPDSGRTFDLGDREMVGRDRSCTVRLTDRRVSGVHAHISLHGGSFVYQDLQATNSSYLVRNSGSERRLTAPHTLRDGDELRVGETLLRFVDLQGGRRR